MSSLPKKYEDLIAARLAAPKRFRVRTTYDTGRVRTHDTETKCQADSWAIGERRKVGRALIDRETGDAVSVVSVEIVSL